jgi:hypothetical protein
MDVRKSSDQDVSVGGLFALYHYGQYWRMRRLEKIKAKIMFDASLTRSSPIEDSGVIVAG